MSEDFIEIDYVENVRAEKRNDDRVTDPTMTPNEYVSLVSWRAKQLKVGWKPTIEWAGPHDPIAIAKEEINRRVVPGVILRRIPDANFDVGFRIEVWEVKDMDIRDC